MNALVHCRAMCDGPKGPIVLCQWLRVTDCYAGKPVAIGLPALRSWGRRKPDGTVQPAETPTVRVVGITVRVKTPQGWGVRLAEGSPAVEVAGFGGSLLPKTGDLVVSFAPLDGWFEVTQ